MRKSILAISYYKNPDLVSNLEVVLSQLKKTEYISRVVAINDSPEDDALDQRLRSLEQDFGITYIKNISNLGYTKSINQAYRLARHEKCNLICVNSDVSFDIENLIEVIDVSTLDERIGFVFPRADSDPNFKWSGFLSKEPTERSRFLPRFDFTPTAVGYFLFVSFAVIDRFPGFDELFSPGYEEENDLVMRAGALGLQPVIANHAAVSHKTSSSFSDTASTLKRKHYEILVRRHPYYEKALDLYSKSPRRRLSSQLMEIKTKQSIMIDCFGFPPVMNGTTIYARGLLKGLNLVNSNLEHQINVLVQPEVEQLLNLKEFSNLNVVTSLEDASPSLMLIRVGQPFDTTVIDRAVNLGTCATNIFFDTIAQDVCSLRSSNTESLWQQLTHAFKDVVFISAASQHAFAARYPLRSARLHTIHPSMNISDYAPSVAWSTPPDTNTRRPRGWKRILVVGNHFPHKDIAYTVNLLAELAPMEKFDIQVLTSLSIEPNPLIKVYPSGALPQETITELYSDCDLVVYPSYYEGFGLPIMEALYFKKPVVVRGSSLVEELKSKIGDAKRNIHCYGDTDQLFELITKTPIWADTSDTAAGSNWKDVAIQVLQVAQLGLDNFSFDDRCEALASLEK